MRVLIAGATGVVGRPLVRALLASGHDVAALTRRDGAARELRGLGVEPFAADVFDARSVIDACTAASPEVVIGELTALPATPDYRHYARDLESTNRLRAEATPNLIAGARAAGARRLIVQSISFLTAPEGPPVHDESAPTFDAAPPALRPAIAATVGMERAVLDARDLDPIVLRYGFFYGPGTYYASDGFMCQEIRRRRFPMVGRGTGISSFCHVADAAGATSAALTGGESGVYNVTDDAPAPMHEWLPFTAQLLGAPAPRRVPAWLARFLVGPHVVFFATTMRGNSNARFKAAFGWTPSRPFWREGFAEDLGSQPRAAR